MPQTPNAPLPLIRPGSSHYYALQSAPLALRPSLQAWVHFWHEVSAIPLTVNDPGVAQTKLAWWHQEVRNSFDGQPAHPLTRPLAQPVPAPGQWPPQDLWLAQVDGMQALVQQTRWLDEVSQKKHALATTGAACEAAAHLLGARSPAALSAARELGWGLRQAHHLSRLGQDARLGWLHTPVSILQQHDVKAHELLRPSPGQAPEHWPALLTYLHAQARQNLTASWHAIAQLPRAERQTLRPLAVLAALQIALIDEIAAQGARVLHERIMLTPLRKWWIATQVRWAWFSASER
ncbi:MAG: squalene/phytoene synthase family protein [Aquabacterium sp.]|uniref:squalene/phytoene synthase family protein n=1 Tax=Aquabacterium sp. TaxID=1872578 RepID=UPI0027263DF5|nr:squalene/phytoene synthase family protein [Aquabacterium sp.]MDO9002721.1 squalene/phytoene synthase family protein [Aquabacterium sp.]